MAAKLQWLAVAALLFASLSLNESRLVEAAQHNEVTAEEAMQDAKDRAAAEAAAITKEPQTLVKDDGADDVLSRNMQELTSPKKEVPQEAPKVAAKPSMIQASEDDDEKKEDTKEDDDSSDADDDSAGATPQEPEHAQEATADEVEQAHDMTEHTEEGHNVNEMAADEVEELEEEGKLKAPQDAAAQAPKDLANLPADEVEEIEERQAAEAKPQLALVSPSSFVDHADNAEDAEEEWSKFTAPVSKVKLTAAPQQEHAHIAVATKHDSTESKLMKQRKTEQAEDEWAKFVHVHAKVIAPVAVAPPSQVAPVALAVPVAAISVAPHGVGQASAATQEMEKSVTDLFSNGAMSAAAFFATPMGGSVKQIQTMIEKKMIAKVLEAHKDNQGELNQLMGQVHGCRKAKNTAFGGVTKQKKLYKRFSPLHKACRGLEAVKFTSATGCAEELRDKQAIKNLKCEEFAAVSNKVGDENANRAIVMKGGSESVDSYVRRITATVCGGKGGKGGMLDKYLHHKGLCNKATNEWKAMKLVCKRKAAMFSDKKTECNNLQDQMDFAACQRTVLVKDACESYAECYTTKIESYNLAKKAAMKEEVDRKAEWRALKRMLCYIKTFGGGKVSVSEVKACKGKTFDTNHLIINYPKVPKLDLCTVPDLYPTTPAYKKAEFTPLPTLAKGKEDANECVGVLEISTKPKHGSPKKCKCKRITLNGPYSAGPMVKCMNCLDIRRSQDKNSCPEGTKVFSPRSAKDWKTFIASAQPLRNPHWVLDVTRPANGCGGCTANPMNSANKKQGKGKTAWRTSDRSPWWLRSNKYNEPNGDYHANCYLDLWHTPKSEKSVTFNDGSCGYHSKSYYCQPVIISTRPAKGSPTSCKCKVVALTGRYSAGNLLRCMNCKDVRKKSQQNSCPSGTKLFSPRTRADWKTLIDSTKPIRSPHWIIDVTRPQNGCGGCTKHPMKATSKSQATWRTSDGSAWWLRSSKYSEPNGDYTANCYLDLWHAPSNADSVTFNDGRCNYHSNSYFCQPKMKKKKKRTGFLQTVEI